MGYLEDIKGQIDKRDFPKFLQLWEEYCTSDTVDVEEFFEILENIKNSEMAKSFGQIVETALPLWGILSNKEDSYVILKQLIDLQTSNSSQLAELTYNALKERYGQDPFFNERLKFVGMRTRENFQGALSNYDLLYHMEKGRFVFHGRGWGTGQVIDISPVREQVTIAFEHLAGKKHITYENAFKMLIPLRDDSFLARRFANPDDLEKDARSNPVKIIKLLLRDLGPKTASEIKEELCTLVIPEEDWAKWWQGVRAKIKKDTMIEAPESQKDSFRLLKTELTHEERLHKATQEKTELKDLILSYYNFARDLPSDKKNQELKNSVKEKLIKLLSTPDLLPEIELQIHIFLESIFSYAIEGKSTQTLIQNIQNIDQVVQGINILAFKKKALTIIHDHREDWPEIFLRMFLAINQSLIKDYILKELNQEKTRKLLKEQLQNLIRNPISSPETFTWYFQKIVSNDKDDKALPFSDKEGQCLFFESFFILFHALEAIPEYRDLVKKMYSLISGKRYEVVRNVIEGTSLDFINEFLLLISKCQTFTSHDMKILRSLAEVVHPSLATSKSKNKGQRDDYIIWTTEKGYRKAQEHIRQIGTVEIVENAREIEAARALGDLRENSEYKFALEKRAQLQGELKLLSEQLNRARVITPADIHSNEVGIGSIVNIVNSKEEVTCYTILGQWDADPDEHILSLHSKFADTMVGLKLGEKFKFKDEEYKIVGLKSYLDT